MSDRTPDTGKPPVASSSREIAAGGNPFANLLSQADLGIKITGLVTAKDDARNVAGTSKGGKPYSFWNQRATVLAGSDTVEITIRKDTAEALPAFDVFSVRKFRVVGVRVNNGLPSYDVELDS
ncbi:hypothetical protein [Luteolibacter soli]|uniref:Helix-destabilizing protein n=1 Tax=Luteolibacter soli TaxID=3135280 RepID=A0ABU9ARQ9_9BACT